VFRQVLSQQCFLRLADGGSAERQRVVIVRRTGFGHLFDAENECFFREVHGPEVVAVTPDAVFPQQVSRRVSRIQFVERIEVHRLRGSSGKALRALVAPGEYAFLLRRSPLYRQIAFLGLSRSQLHRQPGRFVVGLDHGQLVTTRQGLRNCVLTLLGEDGVPNSAIEVVSGDAERAHLTLIGCDAPRDRAATRGLPEDDEFNTEQHRRGWAHGQCHTAHGSAFSTIHEQSLCSHMESLQGYAPPPRR
jgi:hypothetical protein